MVRYNCTLLRAGRLLLDGGSMFGVVPRVVWSRTVQADDRNRIELSHNCLLLTGVEKDPSLGRPRRIVIETGTGDKLPEKMRQIFGLGDITVESALRDAGAEPESIDDVIVSHLHFDHAGGLTRLPREGETPDWSGDDRGGGGAGGVVRTFPNATVHAQRCEWEDALANTAVMTRTYYLDHLLPVEGQIRLTDSPEPFAPGAAPQRHDLPPTALEQRESEILPGITVFRVPGHTWGQQAVRFTDAEDRTVAFTPDVMPSVHHVGAAYSLAYDVEPYTSMLTKHWFLHEAAERGWTLCLDHEPGSPFQRVRRAGDWFELTPESGLA